MPWQTAALAVAVVAGAACVADLLRLVRSVPEFVRVGLIPLSKTGEQFATCAADATVVSVLLSRSAQVLAGTADSVAAATKEISSSLTEMDGTAKGIAADTDQTARAVHEAQERSTAIGERNQRSLDVSQTAAELAVASEGQISQLQKATSTIASVVEMMGSIASQTGLLALNASVEAARAGEAGRGFAVVAGEVKNLASKSSDAAEDIVKCVGEIDEITRETIAWMRQISSVIQEVSTLANETAGCVGEQSETMGALGCSIDDTSSGIHRVTSGIGELSSAGRDISSTMAMVNSAVAVLSQQAVVARRLGDDLTTVSGEFEARVQTLGAGQKLVVDVPGIKAAHNAWKTRLGQLIDGDIQIDPKDVKSDRDCHFGQWYYGDGQRVCGHSETFKQIAEPHARVHAAALECTSRMRAGQDDAAVAAYGQLAEASAELFVLLDGIDAEFNKRCGNRSAAVVG